MYRIYIDKGYHTQIFRANLGGAGEAVTDKGNAWEKDMDPEFFVQPELVQEVTKGQLSRWMKGPSSSGHKGLKWQGLT